MVIPSEITIIYGSFILCFLSPLLAYTFGISLVANLERFLRLCSCLVNIET